MEFKTSKKGPVCGKNILSYVMILYCYFNCKSCE